MFPRLALLTRPQEDSEHLSQALEKLGFQSFIEPMLHICPISGIPLVFENIQGILVTSINGIRALATIPQARSIPLWAVGAVTAEMARKSGLIVAGTAHGETASLAELIIQSCNPEAGTFLHAVGAVQAGNLSGLLTRAGFEVQQQIMYEAKPATILTEHLQNLLKNRMVGAVLFFSPRTAEIFVGLVKENKLEKECENLLALCLSSAVAGKLEDIIWREVVVATRPDGQSMLACLEQRTD